jgi:transposase
VARRTKRLWTDEEKRSICFQTAAPDISVAQVARRYAMNANLIFKWLRDSRFAPEPETMAKAEPCFLPVEIVDHAAVDKRPPSDARAVTGCSIEIDLSGGYRLRVNGAFDPVALSRLIRGLSE